MADEEETGLGCEHYRRKCAFVSPCCGKVYTCRLCHDEKEVHEIDRKSVQQIKCLQCGTQQAVQKSCESCAAEFGQYFCAICRLFDDVDREQFHCDPCGICRVGGRDNFFHCDKCDMCLAIDIQHKCIEKSSRSNCPVCMEHLHTSRLPIHIPKCGHLLHVACYEVMLKTGNYACPICGESTQNMQEYWKMLESEIENVQMPEEYRNTKVWILCKDCHKQSEQFFHVIGMKCEHCGSFNTCRDAEPTEGATSQQTSGVSASGDSSTANENCASSSSSSNQTPASPNMGATANENCASSLSSSNQTPASPNMGATANERPGSTVASSNPAENSTGSSTDIVGLENLDI